MSTPPTDTLLRLLRETRVCIGVELLEEESWHPWEVQNLFHHQMRGVFLGFLSASDIKRKKHGRTRRFEDHLEPLHHIGQQTWLP